MENLANPNPTQKPNNNISNAFKLFILGMIFISIISAYAGGFFTSKFLGQTSTISQTNSPTPTPKENTTKEESTKFLPGKHYYEDTAILITKDLPQLSLVATSTRNEGDGSYTQSQRVSFYNGEKWIRKSDSMITQDSSITTGAQIKKWETNIDPSRVLKQNVNGQVKIDNKTLDFSTNTIQNDIVMRSLPGYTKFMSPGNGTLTVDGQSHSAYVLYTRIYSENASEIQFYQEPLGLTTDWIAFWDKNGNFYHVDSTFVNKPTTNYKTHQIGVYESADGSVEKTFSVDVSRNQKNPPDTYSINLGSPINMVMNLNRINSINKSPSNSFDWYMGNLTGTVLNNGQTIDGVGLAEYIKN